MEQLGVLTASVGVWGPLGAGEERGPCSSSSLRRGVRGPGRPAGVDRWMWRVEWRVEGWWGVECGGIVRSGVEGVSLGVEGGREVGV